MIIVTAYDPPTAQAPALPNSHARYEPAVSTCHRRRGRRSGRECRSLCLCLRCLPKLSMPAADRPAVPAGRSWTRDGRLGLSDIPSLSSDPQVRAPGSPLSDSPPVATAPTADAGPGRHAGLLATFVSAARRQAGDHLIRTSVLTISATVTTSLFGFLYWFIAARVAPPSAIGYASALMSAATAASLLTALGVNGLVVERLPGVERTGQWRLSSPDGCGRRRRSPPSQPPSSASSSTARR